MDIKESKKKLKIAGGICKEVRQRWNLKITEENVICHEIGKRGIVQMEIGKIL